VRQRVVAGIAACLLLSISVTAMASHILEAQRAKVSDEGGARERYDRAKMAYDKAVAELATLGNPRPVSVVQAEVQSTKIDMTIWRRSQQCADISRDDTKAACEPILKLYKERGAAARKVELEPQVNRLRAELAKLERPTEASVSEVTVSGYWAWIMGLGVVFIATFGTVIFARVETAEPPPAKAAPVVTPPAIHESRVPAPAPVGGRPTATKQEALADLTRLLASGAVIASQDMLVERWGNPKGTVSRWLKEWCETGAIPERHTVGRCKQIKAA
jgi:hypothetical protein